MTIDQKDITIFRDIAGAIKPNTQLRMQFYEKVFFCCVAMLYQTATHKETIAEYYCKKLADLIVNDGIVSQHKKNTLLFQFKAHLLKHATDENAERYLVEQVSYTRGFYVVEGKVLSLKEQIPQLFSSIQAELTNLKKLKDSDKNEIFSNMDSSCELRKELIESRESKLKEVLTDYLLEHWKTVLFYFCVLSLVLLYFDPLRLNNGILRLLFNFMLSAPVSVMVVGLPFTRKYSQSGFGFEKREKSESLYNFDPDALVSELEADLRQQQELKHQQKEKITQQQVSVPSPRKEYSEQVQLQTDKTKVISEKKEKTKTRPSFAAGFWRVEESSSTETKKVVSWALNLNKRVVEIDESDIHMLSKGSPTTPLPEGKYFIYYDDEDMPMEQNAKFTSTVQKSIFYPGAAEGKNCIHYLGEGIWSIKRKTSNLRVLGAVIASADNKRLIYFWKVMKHEEMARLLEHKSNFRESLINIGCERASEKFAKLILTP